MGTLPDRGHSCCSSLSASLQHWQTEQLARGYSPEHLSTWIEPPPGTEQAVALLVHGLNLRPSKMNPLAEALAQQGVRVLRVTLHGHSCARPQEFQRVTGVDWLADVLRAYCIATAYTQQHTLPLYYVGYSLGGSLIVELLQQQRTTPLHFDAMVLLAPGIALRSAAATLLWSVPTLIHLPWLRDITPRSRNLPGYACHPGTPLRAYYAERQATHTLRQRGLGGLDHLPTALFVDPADELVSWDGLQRLLHKAALQQWSLTAIHKSPGHLSTAPHHLCIDPQVVGVAQWHTLIAQISQHFTASSRISPQ